MTPDQIPETVCEILDDVSRQDLKNRIRRLLREQDATLVAHYYTDADLQLLADETGGMFLTHLIWPDSVTNPVPEHWSYAVCDSWERRQRF